MYDGPPYPGGPCLLRFVRVARRRGPPGGCGSGIARMGRALRNSASMISEAATTGKPVYVLPLKGGSPRFDRFHQALLREDIVKTFTGKLESCRYTALNDAAMVAEEIRKRMKL